MRCFFGYGFYHILQFPELEGFRHKGIGPRSKATFFASLTENPVIRTTGTWGTAP